MPQTSSGLLSNSGPRLQAVLLEGGQHEVVEDQGQEWCQHAGRGGVVGGFRPRHRLDRPLAELLRVLGKALLGQRTEGRNLGAAGRQGADSGNPGRCRAAPGAPRQPLIHIEPFRA